MLFNSLAFAIFMAVVFVVYWLIPDRYKYILVFATSWHFYLGFGKYSFIFLLIATIISYVAALLMQKKDYKGKLCGLIVVLAVLSLTLFKYINFLIGTAAALVANTPIAFSPQTLKIVAPVGISFFLFKIISYMVEIRRGTIQAETNFLKYAAYVSFFPQVASGPIGRPAPFFDRLNNPKAFDTAQAENSIRLIVVGLFMKMIIADKLAGYVTKVYNAPREYHGFALMVAAVLFSIQIYCDFAGYSDIANGVAGLLGYEETPNFNQPYFAASVKEFWGRWHISLSTWFRDYIYIPLGGSRVGKAKYARNIIVVFLVSGLWHGANWTFVLWGLLHGLIQVIETWVHNLIAKAKKIDPKALKATGAVRLLKILLVFIFVTIAWVFFKANSVGDALYVLTHMFEGISSPVNYIKSGFSVLGINGKMFLHLVVIMGMLIVYDIIAYNKNIFELVDRLPKVVRYILYVVIIDLMVIWMMQYGADTGAFVYFQF